MRRSALLVAGLCFLSLPARAQGLSPFGPPMTPEPSGASGLTIGSPIAGPCASGDFVYSNAGSVGCSASSSSLALPQALSGGTPGGIAYFPNTTTMSSSPGLAANALMVGGGAGAAPSTITTGAGVLSALGVGLDAFGGLIDNWIDAAQVGVDCTGIADSTAAIQAVFTAKPSAHLRFPFACVAKISSTITVTGGAGTTIDSATFAGGGSGAPSQIIWAGTNGGSACNNPNFSSCVYMFDFEETDHPVVHNLMFYSPGGSNCPDGDLKFDGNPITHIGTNGRISGNTFSNGNCNNANFVGVNISQTANNNQEDYVVADNSTYCSGSAAAGYAHDGVTNGTTTLTSATAGFTIGLVGQRIRISYASGLLDTTIAAYVSATQVTLAAAPAWSQTGVTIIIGTSYGTGIRLGASQNALQQQFTHLQYNECAYGIDMHGGSAEMSQVSGGRSDTGINIGGFVAQNTSVDYYASEGDIVGVFVHTGNVAPISISHSRFSNGSQNANGMVIIGANVVFDNNLFNFLPPTNGVWIGNDSNAGRITSINNAFNPGDWPNTGYAAFTSPPVTSINDQGFSTAPGTEQYGCVLPYAACMLITSYAPHAGGSTLSIDSEDEFSGDPTTPIIGITSHGPNIGSTGSFTSILGMGTPGRFATTQTAVEAAWDPTGIDASGTSGVLPTAAYGFFTIGPSAVIGGAPLPNLYGLYIAKQNTAKVTNAWGVYQADAGDANSFAGPTTFGSGVTISPVAIASLPTCNSGSVGMQEFVSNGLAAPTYHQAVSTTGTGEWPVSCAYNGSAYGWVY